MIVDVTSTKRRRRIPGELSQFNTHENAPENPQDATEECFSADLILNSDLGYNYKNSDQLVFYNANCYGIQSSKIEPLW